MIDPTILFIIAIPAFAIGILLYMIGGSRNDDDL